MIDHPSLPLQLSCDPAIAIGGPCACHALDGLFKGLFLFVDLETVVIVVAWKHEHLAGSLHRINPFEHGNHFPFLLAGAFEMLKAFFHFILQFERTHQPL